jgi:hypothetical protein
LSKEPSRDTLKAEAVGKISEKKIQVAATTLLGSCCSREKRNSKKRETIAVPLSP